MRGSAPDQWQGELWRVLSRAEHDNLQCHFTDAFERVRNIVPQAQGQDVMPWLQLHLAIAGFNIGDSAGSMSNLVHLREECRETVPLMAGPGIHPKKVPREYILHPGHLLLLRSRRRNIIVLGFVMPEHVAMEAAILPAPWCFRMFMLSAVP